MVVARNKFVKSARLAEAEKKVALDELKALDDFRFGVLPDEEDDFFSDWPAEELVKKEDFTHEKMELAREIIDHLGVLSKRMETLEATLAVLIEKANKEAEAVKDDFEDWIPAVPEIQPTRGWVFGFIWERR